MPDETAIDARKLLILHAKALRSHEGYSKLITNPRPGDLVYEDSTGATSSIGRLVLTRKEFVAYTDEPGGYWDDVWYVEGDLDGRLQRWRNCEFRRILEQSLWEIRRDGDIDRSAWVAAAMERHRDELETTR